MALMDELAARGITSEDLEKAASARLFEQAAAAEGIDLDTLNDSQINELYDVWANGDAGEAKTASAGEIEEAHAKLAEAEILGRHMARSYMDELGKEAAEPTLRERAAARLKPITDEIAAARKTHGQSLRAQEQMLKNKHPDARGTVGRHGKALLTVAKKHRRLAAGIGAAGALGAAGTAGAAYGVHRAIKGRGEKTASFDALAEARAIEILEANGYDVGGNGEVTIDQAVDAGAWEILSEMGFSQE